LAYSLGPTGKTAGEENEQPHLNEEMQSVESQSPSSKDPLSIHELSLTVKIILSTKPQSVLETFRPTCTHQSLPKQCWRSYFFGWWGVVRGEYTDGGYGWGWTRDIGRQVYTRCMERRPHHNFQIYYYYYYNYYY